ncbi:hypothetical protein HYH02_008230 [Chlamydomonas schloesseri]|uniref:Protein kinase domain-containing protein n=1 Tax=Chlamydomonas schloesseri TaxID=2026947 RepID=A0A836B3K6_9CHLO|nr:hypothetical protein HYH02_008230 [Chlamydomonas schloesseri]|eukprot:KAG2446660.1 hypothetical protein HYH02_008230 [Chlamydomonas schloesseri]
MNEKELIKLVTRRREVERKVKRCEADVEKIDRKIAGIEEDIDGIGSELKAVAVQLEIPGLSTDEKMKLRTEKEQLRSKEERLGRKEEQLRTEKEQLRREKEKLFRDQEQLQTQEAQLRAKLRRTVSSSQIYLDRALLMGPPSKTNMKREQLDGAAGPLILNWRPTQDKSGGLLPELAHRTFGEVADLLASDTAVDQTVINVASQLCCIGADIWDNEAQLTKRIRGLLLPFLEDEMVTTIESGFADSSVSPDWALGDSPKNPTNLFLIAEVKPGIGGTGDSHFQGANYHVHFWRQRSKSSIFKSTRCPAFLLEVVGPHARLSAVAWLNRVTIFPLTPLLNLLPAHPVTDQLLMPVARMLAALRAGLRKLAQDHATAEENEVAQAAPANAADAETEGAGAEGAEADGAEADDAEADDAEADDAEADDAEADDAVADDAEADDAVADDAEADDAEADAELAGLQEAVRMRKDKLPWPIAMDARYQAATAHLLAAPNHTYRVCLTADKSGRTRVVAVKLCQSYGLAAHRRWADLGLAPKILRSMPLPGGWLLVEMEWLSASQWQPLSELSGQQLDEARCAVQQALECAHAATGMVHGDVRPPNCLVRCSKASWEVRFVDFEWAGPEGEATYPACLNPDIPWPEGVGYRKQLQREHDFQLLAATLTTRGGGAASFAASTGTTAGSGRQTRGRGAVRSLNIASSSERSAAPPGITAVVARHRIASMSWRQRGAVTWARPAAPSRRLAW